MRSEFLVLIYFAHLLPPDRVAGIIDQMIARWEPLVEQVEAFAAAADRPRPDAGDALRRRLRPRGARRSTAYVREHRAQLLGAITGAATPAPERIALAGD